MLSVSKQENVISFSSNSKWTSNISIPQPPCSLFTTRLAVIEITEAWYPIYTKTWISLINFKSQTGTHDHKDPTPVLPIWTGSRGHCVHPVLPGKPRVKQTHVSTNLVCRSRLLVQPRMRRMYGSVVILTWLPHKETCHTHRSFYSSTKKCGVSETHVPTEMGQHQNGGRGRPLRRAVLLSPLQTFG